MRRLAVTAAVITAAVVGVGAAVNANSSGGGRPTAAPGPGSPTPSTSGAPEAPSSPAPSPSESKDLSSAIETARAFVVAWADHKAPTSQAWYAGAALYATDELAMQLTSVDYLTVPATRISGPLRLTDTGGVGRTQVAVPTDAGPMSVSLTDYGQGWQVSDIQPGTQAVE
ncbi:hypothetical protein [Streptomyces sp. NPDC057966]|uniref:hypothetical protein n=1 Tax=Streptomyces sp. NPDC057966 TaxID=3346292 RepID=UPI0036EF8AEB